jgi:dienelactone hydrolase
MPEQMVSALRRRTWRAIGALAALLVFAASPALGQASMVPVPVDGSTVKLATITHKPAGAGPFPILIFHHGSTGRGTDSSVFARPYEPIFLADWFVARGWAVVFPSRRGRGGSEGLYDEGFEIDRTRGYACDDTLSVKGFDRALRDADAITAAILALPFADRSRFVVGGQSRGGILSIGWSGQRPDLPKGVLNFVGGWLGSGCSYSAKVNAELFKRGTAFKSPTLWQYGDKDPFYPLGHSRGSFEAFKNAGGNGSFNEYTLPDGVNGHSVASFPQLWEATMERYLVERGLPATHIYRPLTDDEIKTRFVGKTVDWRGGLRADYRTDGSYEVMVENKPSSKGKYSIADGQVCVALDDGRSRCDRMNVDGRGLFMITASGGKFYGVPR